MSGLATSPGRQCTQRPRSTALSPGSFAELKAVFPRGSEPRFCRVVGPKRATVRRVGSGAEGCNAG